MRRRVLVDSNALDPLIDLPGAYEALRGAVDSGDLEVLFTHVTVDEVAATPDLERRQRLLLFLIDLGHLVPTSATCVEFSRLDFCRLSDDDESFEHLRSRNIRHSRDALIAHTALTEDCALVTNERRLAQRSRDEQVEPLTTMELLAEFGFTPPAPSHMRGA